MRLLVALAIASIAATTTFAMALHPIGAILSLLVAVVTFSLALGALGWMSQREGRPRLPRAYVVAR